MKKYAAKLNTQPTKVAKASVLLLALVAKTQAPKVDPQAQLLRDLKDWDEVNNFTYGIN